MERGEAPFRTRSDDHHVSTGSLTRCCGTGPKVAVLRQNTLRMGVQATFFRCGMPRIRQILLHVVLLTSGPIIAPACAQEEASPGPTHASPEIVLNDRGYQVDLLASISDLDPRVRAALAEMELDIARGVSSATETERQFLAGDGNWIVDVELSTREAGMTRINVTAVRVTPMRGAEVIEDPAYAKLVLQRIVDQG